MGGDYSRNSFDALRDFAGVLMQQGHPTLDADWNEFVAIVERRLRAESVDIIGRAAVPKETPTGFQIVPAAGPQLTIGRGRMYVDGLVAENHGLIGPDNSPIFDRSRLDSDGRAVGVLDETISREPGDFIDYMVQPYLPAAPALPSTVGPHLVYLDVWNREVTPLKDRRLLEPALNGIDTATRTQTVWQVRVLADVGADVTCGADLAAWDALVAPSAARLTTATIEFDDPDEPCLLPPGGGYRGLENQLYRVELHVGGDLGDVRFKWSRDNASVGATIEAIADGNRLQVRRIGRDSILRFRTGDWVEVTDDRREFAGLAGDLRRVEVDEDASELRLDSPLSADLIPGGGADTTASRHSRVIRWDQHGEVRLDDGTLWVDLDAAGSDGSIPVPPAGQVVVLEAGITVRFDLEPAGGQAKALDHWCFAARTAGAQIEILDRAPPLGVHHHYARLAMVTFPTAVVDCRTFWPPEFGDDCACSACVSAEEHNAGTFTIQQAIAQLPETGGTICLSPGTFILGDTPVVIEDRESIRLKGHGAATFLIYAGRGAAVRVIESEHIEILDLGVFVSTDATNAAQAPAAFLLRTCEQVKLQRSIALLLAREGGRGFGVAIDGTHNRLKIADNLLFAPSAIGALADPEREEGLRYCALHDVLIQDNRLMGNRGVALEGLVIHLAVTRIVLNAIDAFEAGIVVTGTSAIETDDGEITGGQLGRNEVWSPGGVAIESNTILLGAVASGVISGVPNLLLKGNEISRLGGQEGPETACCVRLTEGFMPKLQPDCHIVGNRMGRVFGFGISIEATQATLVIKQNLIRDCATGGVRMVPEAQIGSLAFDNNIVEHIGNGARDGRVIGVSLSSVVDGKVIGNSINRIGQGGEAAEYVAGLEVHGAMLLDISHNAITDIGPAAGPKELYAIRLHGPLQTANISANRLIGVASAAENDPMSWSGIALDLRLGVEGGLVPGGPATGVNRFPAFMAVGDRLLSLTARGVSILGRIGGAQIRIDGNVITDARPRSQLPLVVVLAGGEGLSGCVFTGNQCRRLAAAGVTPVILQAPRLAVANNIVRRESDADAMTLQSGTFGGPTATIVGNITFGNIRLNGVALPAPWQALNVLG
ncbi:DUF6519 domain-containing protein [Microvirga arabica]|uniref:DUF6519 domain-containing protein n=1 Tax=Microvirga arabica TaxID=1128671 RepID=A0ABV6Y7C0_9HYPH